MKENHIIKLGYRPGDVADALGSKSLYTACVKAGWLTPIVSRHKLVLFDSEDVRGCYKRLRAGESPFSQTETAAA